MIILLQFLALTISLVIHEYSHGLVAYLQGDETAERTGRLTLNPLPHLDPVGSVVLPLIALSTGFPIIGWAKPVPFNPYNLRNRKWGPTMVALAGPFSNFTLALIFLAALSMVIGPTGLAGDNLLVLFLAQLAVVNVVLGIFNLIPVPPLDGSKLLQALLDNPKHRQLLHTIETKGPTILLFVVMIDLLSPFSILGGIFRGAIGFAFGLFGLL